MTFDGVAGAEGDVIAALHHARATALSNESLDRDRNLGCGRSLLCVKGREQSGASRPNNQDVCIMPFDIDCRRHGQIALRRKPLAIMNANATIAAAQVF
jgi:hypothetical protein